MGSNRPNQIPWGIRENFCTPGGAWGRKEHRMPNLGSQREQITGATYLILIWPLLCMIPWYHSIIDCSHCIKFQKIHKFLILLRYKYLLQWSVNQYLGIGKYLFILQISIMYRFMENSLISISMLSIKKYIMIYWYFQYFTVPFLKSHESFISRVFMKFNTPEASSTHSERLFSGES